MTQQPGMQINELELAREIGTGTTSVREFLIRFSRFGLIEKRPNSHWILKGFTREFALELAEVREMFELHSAAEFGRLPPDNRPGARSPRSRPSTTPCWPISTSATRSSPPSTSASTC
jgi:DNA-binding GntR family transcriptional regulator